MSLQFPIHIAASRAGLTAHVVRIWEKRYAAVSPARTATKRRLYSEAEIDRLILLRRATQHGHRIGDIAAMSTDELKTIVPTGEPSATANTASSQTGRDALIQDALSAIKNLDQPSLEDALARAAVQFGTHGSLQHIVGPLAHAVGEQWASGALTTAHEHFASNIIRSVLLRGWRAYADSPNAPVLIAATPSGQLHELGAVIVAAAARDLGWRVIYLGASVPAADLAGAALQHRARAVALSLVYPPNDPELAAELRFLRSALPSSTDILAGGQSIATYDAELRGIGAVVTRTLDELNNYLARTARHSLGPGVA